MYKKRRQRHFITHTIEHLFGVFAIVAAAATVSYFASAQTTLTTSSVSTTILSPTPSPTPTTASTITTGDPISFSVIPAPQTDCSDAQPKTRVFFAVSSALGGSFEVTSDTGMQNARLEWGEYPLPNGKYTWRAIVNTGFVSTGSNSGSFELSGTCTTASSGASDWLTASSPLSYPETSLVTPTIFLKTAAILDGGTVSDVVSFSATAPSASRLGFVLSSPTLGARSFGAGEGVVFDTVLHVGKLNWNSVSVPNGDYSLIALLDTSEGIVRSKKISFHVVNETLSIPSSTTQSSSTTGNTTVASSSIFVPSSTPDGQTLPRPILKVFFDNKPVTDPSRVFDDEDIELRVIVSLAKKVNLVAIDNQTLIATQLGSSVIDDLLTTPGVDVWTYVWNASGVKDGTYKVFARVLRTDGTMVETTPTVITIDHSYHTAIANTQKSEETPLNSPTENERQQVLDRVSDPASCMNAEECKIFCASHVEAKDECVQFSRMHVSTHEEHLPSFADGITDAQVSVMLNDPRKRPQSLPEIIVSAEDFRLYCAQPAHAEVCTKALINNDLASSDALEQKKVDIIRLRDEGDTLFTERVGARMFIDSDTDGVTDYDEINMYHIDPNNADTDHDGFLDGAEILSGTNPLGVGDVSTRKGDVSSGSTTEAHELRATEEMHVENPLISGETKSTLLSVTDVSVAPMGHNEKGTTTAKKLKLSGISLPNSFVRIYIFSDPIVVTVKADDTGAWTYVLDKELPDGTHQVISALTDSGGRILAKSEPLPFIKEAAAISVGTTLLPQTKAAPGFFSGASFYALIAILIALLGLGLSVIGFVVYRKGETDGQTPVS